MRPTRASRWAAGPSARSRAPRRAAAAVGISSTICSRVGARSAMLAGRPRLAAAASGINAAVVGLLLAALYRPVFTSAVQSGLDLGLAIAGFWILVTFRPPILLLVAAFAAAGVGRVLL